MYFKTFHIAVAIFSEEFIVFNEEFILKVHKVLVCPNFKKELRVTISIKDFIQQKEISLLWLTAPLRKFNLYKVGKIF